MIKVAVCDDDKQVCAKLVTIVKEYFSDIERAVWVAEFTSGSGLLKANIRFDVIFLDIDMPGLNGIQTAKKLRNWDVNSKIIYITNYGKYKSCAYQVHAFDYVEKPVRECRIFDVLKEVVHYLDNAVEKQKYAFTTEEGVVTLELDDIYYFEYMLRRVRINTAQGNYTATYSLKELYGKFNKYNFESPHKSFIINMLHIKYIKGFDILMENGVTIPLAQKRAVEFKAKFNNFLQSTFDKI
ncbi:LytR/AlgR family response regulator transcription factor [Petralouisia muris]|uniref:LytR/AlgR family response regulator transcription factor n=1 Tax=Petralouisia muris TaxID=3032872 RepID=UPI001441DB13|nr:LytTR family DNA-binding domain-containing protein [Petralouisia muris]